LIIRKDQNNIGRFSGANKYKEQVDKEEGFFHKLQVCLFSDFRALEGDKKLHVSTCLFLTENFQGSGFIR
jgi:hypothetical protein